MPLKLTCLTTILVSLAGVPAANAAPVSWIGGDGAWEDTGNWSQNALPTAADFVEILHPGAVSSTGNGNIAFEFGNHSQLGISSGSFTTVGTIENFGAVTITNGASGNFGRVNVQPGADFTVSDAGSTTSVTEGIFNYERFTVADEAVVTAESLDNFKQMSVASGGSLTANSLINHGDADLTIDAAKSVLAIHGDVTNQGSIGVTNKGLLDAHSIDNFSEIAVSAAGQARIDSMINKSTFKVSGAGSSLVSTHNITNEGVLEFSAGADTELTTLDNAGSFVIDAAIGSAVSIANEKSGLMKLTGDSDLTVSDHVSNEGQIEIAAAASLTAGRFQQLGGETRLQGGTLGAAQAFGVDFTGGSLLGNGTLAGNLRIAPNATLAPGDASAATAGFEVTGDLALSGLFKIDIAGLSSPDFDHVSVSGAATLGGTLAVSLLGFTPDIGAQFDIITAATVIGSFTDVLLPTLAAGRKFNVVSGTDFVGLRVSAVPVPAGGAMFLLLAMGTLGLAARRRA